MSEERVTGIERDLAALLAVEPSPEFAAGVRERIQAETRSWSWWWAASAAAAAIVLAAALAGRWGNAPVASQLPRVAVAHPADVRLPPSGPIAMVPAPTVVRTVARAPRAADEPVVLIDGEQAEAVRRLLAAAAQAPRTAPVALPVDSSPSEVSAIALNPMVVEPLSVPEPSSQNKGVHQ